MHTDPFHVTEIGIARMNLIPMIFQQLADDPYRVCKRMDLARLAG